MTANEELDFVRIKSTERSKGGLNCFLETWCALIGGHDGIEVSAGGGIFSNFR